MNELLASIEELRRMSAAELTRLGEDSLMEHLRHQAEQARLRHGGLHPWNLETFLSDRDCVRHPTRLVLEYGEMSPHQFAQPGQDFRSDDPSARVLYLRPVLGRRPDLVALAVSYMIPLLNYGDVITDEHCLAYGAILLGLDEEDYHAQLCKLADFVGAETVEADGRIPPAGTGGCGCGGGCIAGDSPPA